MAVRVTHVPTGVSVTCGEYRTEIENRRECLRRLGEQLATSASRHDNMGDVDKQPLDKDFTLIDEHNASFESSGDWFGPAGSTARSYAPTMTEVKRGFTLEASVRGGQMMVHWYDADRNHIGTAAARASGTLQVVSMNDAPPAAVYYSLFVKSR